MVIRFPPGHRMTPERLRAGLTVLLGHNFKSEPIWNRQAQEAWAWESPEHKVWITTLKNGESSIFITLLPRKYVRVIESWTLDTAMIRAYEKTQGIYG
jgi:hypothetical protein